jgi:hypothetical protein
MIMIVGKTLSHLMAVSMQSMIYVQPSVNASHNIESMMDGGTAGTMTMKMYLIARKIYVLEFVNIDFNVHLINRHV